MRWILLCQTNTSLFCDTNFVVWRMTSLELRDCSTLPMLLLHEIMAFGLKSISFLFYQSWPFSVCELLSTYWQFFDSTTVLQVSIIVAYFAKCFICISRRAPPRRTYLRRSLILLRFHAGWKYLYKFYNWFDLTWSRLSLMMSANELYRKE